MVTHAILNLHKWIMVPDACRFSVFIEIMTWQLGSPCRQSPVGSKLGERLERGGPGTFAVIGLWSTSGSHISLVSSLVLKGWGSLSLSVAVFGAGGFTHEELLKVWKGLFYCMWMQDKLLLQVSVWEGGGRWRSSVSRRTDGHVVDPGQSFTALMLFYFLMAGGRGPLVRVGLMLAELSTIATQLIISAGYGMGEAWGICFVFVLSN